MLTNILIFLSGAFTVFAVTPYLIEVVRGNTKPRVVTWLIWSVLTSIACAAAFIEGQYSTAILLLSSSAGTLAIAILGWKRGDKKIERLDVICLVGAIVGLILWWLFNSPAIAVVVIIAVDFIGGVPTIVHSWKKPEEETWSEFALAFLGAVCTLIVLQDWRVTALAYPVYLVINNLVFTSVIILRKRFLAEK